MILGTWNVLSLYRSKALANLLDQLKPYKIDITCIQEMRWVGKGTIERKDCTVFYSCHEKEHRLGVGFIVSNRIKCNVINFEAINERLCKIRIKGKFFNYSIINIHAPTEDKEDNDKDSFYELLNKVYDSCPKHDVKMVIGDANAQVGKEQEFCPTIGRNSIHETTNNNGERLIDFAASRNQIIGSTMFNHKKIHLATWSSPGKTYFNQIDRLGS